MTEEAKKTADRWVAHAMKVVLGIILYLSVRALDTMSEVKTELGEVKTEVRVLRVEMENVSKRMDGLAELEARVRRIEENRFTAGDGMALWRELSEIKGRLPTTFPPTETLRRLDAIEKRLLEWEKRK